MKKSYITIAVVLVVIAAGAYLLAGPKQSATTNEQPATSTDTTSGKDQTPSTPVAPSTSTAQDNGWALYNNAQYGYQISYPTSAVMTENTKYPGAYLTTLKATVFTLPTSYTGGTSTVANISVAVSTTTCALWADGISTFHPSKTIQKPGGLFTVVRVNEGGKGESYSAVEYSTPKDNLCYRVTLFVHGAIPSPLYDKKMNNLLDVMAGTFNAK